jgi:hypothetical protein
MCEANVLEVLSMNGLQAAEGCKYTTKFPFSGVALFNTIGGTLPECLWHLKNLTTLHLTGNGLTGTVVAKVPPYSRMSHLSLSHNKLSGGIPLGIEKVQKVDLSYNQFSGTFEDSTGEWQNLELNLKINRLSGQLPEVELENVTADLNILRGNMFSCDTIPENDDFVNDYVCGSTDLNESLYVFLSVLSMTGLIVLVILLYPAVASSRFVDSLFHFACISRLHTYMAKVKDDTDVKLQPIVSFCAKLHYIRWLFVQLFVIVLIIGAPIYIGRGVDDNRSFSSHTDTYSWFWTLAYMRGIVPSSVILVSWSAIVGVCFYGIMLTPLTEENSPADNQSCSSNCKKDDEVCEICLEGSDESVHNGVVDGFKTHAWIAAGLLFNAAVTITVNVLYIYSTEQPLSAVFRFGMQLNLALFRMAYSYIVCPFLSRAITDPVANIRFWLRLLIVNNLVIPCIVTAFASPACFQVV